MRFFFSFPLVSDHVVRGTRPVAATKAEIIADVAEAAQVSKGD